MHDDDLRYMVEGYMGRVTMVQLTHTARRCETLHVRRRKLVNKGEKFGKDNARIENTRKGTRYEEGRKEGRKKDVGRRLEWQAGKAKNVERKGKELGAKPPFPSVVRYSPAIRRPRSRLP
ncbi:hypothetical protein HZH66_006251 [Vespula vulgaris]|uniref:Uncharacterized protein n=1 Tax=Vespula vulgaris TaxID=7454 RepID=A0A834K4P7_VESVU|nr:hypothetical protein HZH66_006251 [Vespula vulgaris]